MGNKFKCMSNRSRFNPCGVAAMVSDIIEDMSL